MSQTFLVFFLDGWTDGYRGRLNEVEVGQAEALADSPSTALILALQRCNQPHLRAEKAARAMPIGQFPFDPGENFVQSYIALHSCHATSGGCLFCVFQITRAISISIRDTATSA